MVTEDTWQPLLASTLHSAYLYTVNLKPPGAYKCPINPGATLVLSLSLHPRMKLK